MQLGDVERLVNDALQLLPWMHGFEELEGSTIDWIDEQIEATGGDKIVEQALRLLSEGKIRPSKPHNVLPKLCEVRLCRS